MNTEAIHVERPASDDTALKVAMGGSAMEAAAGIAAGVLAIIGLLGVWSIGLAAIATILLGASLLFEGGAVTASQRLEAGGLVTVEFLAGVAGIVLGILALLGISPIVLISVSVLAFGCALLLAGGRNFGGRLGLSSGLPAEGMEMRTGGGHVLVALAAIVLGILALRQIDAMVLNLVALLTLGVFVLLNSAAFGAKSWSLTKHTEVRATTD